MIKVSVFYPNEEGKKFDMGYYFNKHIPMVQQKLGAACKRVAVEQGLGGAEPGSRATYIVMFLLSCSDQASRFPLKQLLLGHENL
jgi:uncharacterized protein (TIGR02118 family)